MTTAQTTLNMVADKLTQSMPSGLLAPWREAWNHELARYYRARIQPNVPSDVAKFGVWTIWLFLLIGTALGVILYPAATEAHCRFVGYCVPAGITFDHPFVRVLSSILQFFLLGALCPLPAVFLLLAFIDRLRKGPRRRPIRQFLKGGWQTGPATLEIITPLGALGLLRIYFLTWLYYMWQRRAMLIMFSGAVATPFVCYHVLAPNFWWLGPWGNWLAQLVLVGLWMVVMGMWLVAQTAFVALRDVANIQGGRDGFLWRFVPLLAFLVIFFVPGVVLFRVLLLSNSADPVANAMNAFRLPLALLATGAAIAVLNYAMAHWVLRMRLWIGGPQR